MLATNRQYPRRPPRLTQLFQGHRPLYFITFNTHQRRPILAEKTIHSAFREFGQKAQIRGIAVGRYVILPDHIHLFVALPEGGVLLTNWMRSMKLYLGKTLTAAGVAKPYWQEGFFDHLLRHNESYRQKWEYVRLNPVRAGLVSDPDAWPYQGEIIPIDRVE